MDQERQSKDSPQSEWERELADRLTEGDMERANPSEAARKMLSPKYEIRIQAELDPVVEEILRYRQIAREVDGRYDKYLEKALARRRQAEEHVEPEDNGNEIDPRNSGNGDDS